MAPGRRIEPTLSPIRVLAKMGHWFRGTRLLVISTLVGLGSCLFVLNPTELLPPTIAHLAISSTIKYTIGYLIVFLIFFFSSALYLGIIGSTINRTTRVVATLNTNSRQSIASRGGGASATAPANAPDPIAIMVSAQSRLSEELKRQAGIGSFNLIAGLTLLGLGLLWVFFIIYSHVDGTLNLIDLLSRALIALSIQIVAFFFFANYRRSMSETRFLHNEINNIAFRMCGLLVSEKFSADKSIGKYVTQRFMDEERNTILKKGESTADIKRFEMDNELISSLTTQLALLASKLAAQKGEKNPGN